jgi:hypothetical protein
MHGRALRRENLSDEQLEALLLEGICPAGFPPQTAKRWPGFRHKPRNQNLCGEVRLKQACGRCWINKTIARSRKWLSVVGVPAGDRYGRERRSNRDGRDAFRLSALARIRFRGACSAAGRYRICRIDRAEHLKMGDRALFVLA